MKRGGINASTIPTITQGIVRYIDEQTSQSALQRDAQMAFNKTAQAEANFVLASFGKAPSKLNFRN